MAGNSKFVLGLVLVVASMVFLFSVPTAYFTAATFVSTSCMMVVAFALAGLRRRARLRYTSLALGLATAALLYLIFFSGAFAIDLFHPFGISSASESSVYSLVASPSNPLYAQVVVLLFDSAGYESFFRGVLQKRLQSSMGVGAAPAVALLDAMLHVITLNPIWVAGTFVTDLIWGLTYHYGKGTQASFTSHFIWDLAIFIVRPVM